MTRWGRPSLGNRLLVWLIVASFTYWAAIALVTIRDSIDEVYAIFDAQLAQTAVALLRVVDPNEDSPMAAVAPPAVPRFAEIFRWPELHDPQGRSADPDLGSGAAAGAALPLVAGAPESEQARHERNLRYQVWGGGGRLLLRSANAPSEVMAIDDGYSETTDGHGLVWRHFAVVDLHRDFRVVVSESSDGRNRLIRGIALHLATPLALGLPVLVVLLWLSITRGLDPLGVLTRELAERAPENLAPLEMRKVPQELGLMVATLNRLLRRVASVLEGERTFTANAAHELRTPLAALQAQLHAARLAGSDCERESAFDQLQRGVQRGIRLVNQLLNLARLDPEQSLPNPQTVDLHAVAQEVCAELAPQSMQRDQLLELDDLHGLPGVAGNADMLAVLLRNLIENAIRYGHPGGKVRVRMHVADRGVVVAVQDNGPGIPAHCREQVFARFYRVADGDQAGTGLGLAICRRIVELHAGRIALLPGPDGGGVSAEVWLPWTPNPALQVRDGTSGPGRP
jgi:two-component system sensor histidine kinase QseC